MENNQQKSYSILWDEKEGILRIGILSYLDKESAIRLCEESVAVADQHNGRVPTLVDLSGCDSASFAARQSLVELFKSGKATRCAFINHRIFDRALIRMIMRAAEISNMEFFKNEEEALKWLKEGGAR